MGNRLLLIPIDQVGKLGASILNTLGHPEWIATEEDYINKAVTLALDTNKLAQIHATLRTEMEASPMMDPNGFIHELENTYRAMWKKCHLSCSTLRLNFTY